MYVSSYNGYCVYEVSGSDFDKVNFLVDYGNKEPSEISVPLFKISNLEHHRSRGNDYECLKENIKAAEDCFDENVKHHVKTTIVVVNNDTGRYGICVAPGFVVGLCGDYLAYIKPTVFKKNELIH